MTATPSAPSRKPQLIVAGRRMYLDVPSSHQTVVVTVELLRSLVDEINQARELDDIRRQMTEHYWRTAT